jgi:dihydroflavonol-4-reductase
VHVDDVARGTALALEKPRPGGRYVLGGENVTLAQFYETIGRLTGAKIPTLRLPDGVAKVAGALQKGWAGLRGATPQLTPDLVEIYKHDWAFSSAHAESELGYRWRTLAEGLSGTIVWLKESGPWPSR